MANVKKITEYLKENIDRIDEVGENGVDIVLNNGLGIGLVINETQDYFEAHLLDNFKRLSLKDKAVFNEDLKGDHSMSELSQILFRLVEILPVPVDQLEMAVSEAATA